MDKPTGFDFKQLESLPRRERACRFYRNIDLCDAGDTQDQLSKRERHGSRHAEKRHRFQR
jgi:hypothetical protein